MVHGKSNSQQKDEVAVLCTVCADVLYLQCGNACTTALERHISQTATPSVCRPEKVSKKSQSTETACTSPPITKAVQTSKHTLPPSDTRPIAAAAGEAS